MRAQHSNSRSYKLRRVLELSPSGWSLVEAASKIGAIPISSSRVSTFGEREVEGRRLTNSRVEEALTLRPDLWSQGDVRLMPGVKLCRGQVFTKDLWIGFVRFQ
jgi:hypothetical protein